MTKYYSTQCSPAATKLFPIPPKEPLFLSMKELRAYMDIDLNGIKRARKGSRLRLTYLATCLATEVIRFNSQYPTTPLAGFVLNIEAVLPVKGAREL